MRERVEKVISEEVGPMLAMHGGGVELVDLTEDGVVKVKLTGGCAGCPGARMTLTQVVESTIRQRVPEITRVEAVD